VLRSATVPFFYDKKNGTVALRSTLELISEHAHFRPPGLSTLGKNTKRFLMPAHKNPQLIRPGAFVAPATGRIYGIRVTVRTAPGGCYEEDSLQEPNWHPTKT